MCKWYAIPAAALVLAAQLAAGGFWAVLGNPEADAEARAMHAAATVRVMWCHQPQDANVVGTAIGSVDGRRHSIPLKLARLSQPGFYAVTQQWPTEGKWVVQIVATQGSAVTSILAGAGSAGVDRSSARQQQREPTAEEVEGFLRTMVAQK